MERLLFGLALFAFIIGACKSDSKEVTSETTADTTMVTQAFVEVSVDSAAMAAEEAEAQKNMAAKPASTEKSTGADKKAAGAAATATTTTTTTTTPPPAGSAEKGTEAKADLGYVEFPSKRATYPGGQAALNKYLSNNIKYPPLARENTIEGTVYASILVDEQGNIVDITYPKPLGYGLEEEVTRVIKGMPKLIPAEDQSKPVKTKYVLPVKFDLK